MPHPLLETITLTETVRKFATPSYFFTEKIFPIQNISTNQVEWYIDDYTRRVAPLRGRGSEGRYRPRQPRELKRTALLHTRPKDLVLYVDMQTLRRPGSSDTSEAYGRQLVLDSQETLRRQVDRTMEWVGAQMLQAATASFTIDEASITLNTGMPSTNVVTANYWWGDPGSSIVQDIANAKNIIERDSGEVADFILMASSLETTLINNNHIDAYLQESADVNTVIREGHIPRLLGLDVITYDQYYVPDDGSVTRIWSPCLALVGCYATKSKARMFIGPPTDADAPAGVGGGMFSKVWKSEDPSGFFIIVDANFFPALPIPEAYVVIDTTP